MRKDCQKQTRFHSLFGWQLSLHITCLQHHTDQHLINLTGEFVLHPLSFNLSIPMFRRTSKNLLEWTGISWKKDRKGSIQKWKQDPVTQQKYRQKPKHAGLGLEKPRSVWNWIWRHHERHQEGFHRSISNKRRTEENTALVMDGAVDLRTRGVGKAEVCPDFALFFFVKTCLQESQVPEISGKVWSNAILHLSKGRCS